MTTNSNDSHEERTSRSAQAREDALLVEETLAGNQLSFQLLVERYQERLFALARHYTKNPVEIEDVVQESFLKAFRRLDTFHHQSSFYTWIYRIATNTILDFLKRRGRSPIQSVEDPEVLARPEPTDGFAPNVNIEREEIAEVTHKVLAELPDIFRTVLVMREFEERSYQEIADVLGISIGTVESRLFRARARFRERLTKDFPEFSPGGDA
ncbi:MAG: sigma-70 family RNA polymerase sigma factor [Planctomycetes bacterium]|nr:sigma-70 family RNA polymerase sigma factor [Planctomycetota bacterium]